MPRILLIDDDDLLREVLATVLTGAGHTVMQAGDGRRALTLFRAEPADAIVTDIVMPDREGLETIRLLHREHPELPIVAMSGGSANAELYLGLATKLGARRTLTKPFPPAALLRIVEELLAPPPVPASPPPHENSPR